MRLVKVILPAALLALGLIACGKSGGTSDGTAVLATVNGTPVTAAMLDAFIRSSARGQVPQLTDEQRRSFLDTVINMEVLAQEAQRSGLADKPDTAATLRVNHDRVLAGAILNDYMQSHQPTDDQIKAAYDAQVKGMDTHQYKARHILVQSETQAEDIIAQLNKGADFATLAKKYSADPTSAANGGELGDWFSPQSLAPEFSAALVALKKGQYTRQPVHTQYGWHVIKLEDVRDQPVPGMDEMRAQLEEKVQGDTVQGYINGLRSSAQIKMSGPTPAPAPATKKP